MARRIGRSGTVSRIVLGAVLVASAFLVGMSWWDVGAAVLVLPLVSLVAAIIMNRILGRDQRSEVLAFIGVMAVLVVVFTALTFVSPVYYGGLLLFVGGSMVLAGLLGYDGCEVLALPNLVLRRRDSIWCLLYSPLDRLDSGRS